LRDHGCPWACPYRHRPACCERRTNRGHTVEIPVGRFVVGRSPLVGGLHTSPASWHIAEILVTPMPC
jgi:hypothetical protein